jgi:ferredoxin-NADP reductase
MWQFDSELAEVIQRTPTVKSFRFPIRAKGVRYRAGQFFYLTIKVRGADALHHFSISSSPTDKGYVEFTKRITASDFSQALDVLKPGYWANLQGPDSEAQWIMNDRKPSGIPYSTRTSAKLGAVSFPALARVKKSARNSAAPAANPHADTQNTAYQSFIKPWVVR